MLAFQGDINGEKQGTYKESCSRSTLNHWGSWLKHPAQVDKGGGTNFVHGHFLNTCRNKSNTLYSTILITTFHYLTPNKLVVLSVGRKLSRLYMMWFDFRVFLLDSTPRSIGLNNFCIPEFVCYAYSRQKKSPGCCHALSGGSRLCGGFLLSRKGLCLYKPCMLPSIDSSRCTSAKVMGWAGGVSRKVRSVRLYIYTVAMGKLEKRYKSAYYIWMMSIVQDKWNTAWRNNYLEDE